MRKARCAAKRAAGPTCRQPAARAATSRRNPASYRPPAAATYFVINFTS